MVVSKLIVLIGVAAMMQLSYSAPSSNVCVCTREFLPICGTDDVTYYNTCLFECEKKHNKALKIKFHGECVNEVEVLASTQKPCVCTDEYSPVCGSDDRTYANECMLKCEKRIRKDLKLKHLGECGDEVEVPASTQKPCVCTDEYFPVCGSDDQTYANECMLKCEKRVRKDLKLKHLGECGDEVEIPASTQEPCVCTDEYFPVCGSDDQTYANECILNCEKRIRKDLKLKHLGECDEENRIRDEITENILPVKECACTRFYVPICGTDDKTYANLCTFNCAKKINKNLEVEHQGECS